MGKFQRQRVGNVEMVSVQDSWAAFPASAFFTTVSADKWAAYKEFLDADGNLTLNLGSWLVRSEGRNVLVDTGMGGRPSPMPLKEPTTLPSVLQAAGVRPQDVDIVVFSHLHFDHTGWNTVDEGGKPRLTFPNARHIVQRKEWAYWTGADELRKAAGYDNVLKPVEDAGRLDLVEGEYAVTSEVITVPTPGHTPGHVSFVVASGGQRAYITGDAAHSPVQVSETDWSPGADVDPAESSRSRRALFERIEREGALIASGHFPYPGLGHAVRVGGTRRYRPLA